ncbi:hypothetical protein [Burkholderia ubonensis]|uniref:hypothetical protein n=1 Tax=Burkholderia ubonensis TaxID=101571 RepID=UPI000753AF63|nr:hypothetical protein [Burkholderia ubonensis]KVV07388.1 hypothetical protein WK77_16505 [Burkholderia ubonensis]
MDSIDSPRTKDSFASHFRDLLLAQPSGNFLAQIGLVLSRQSNTQLLQGADHRARRYDRSFT